MMMMIKNKLIKLMRRIKMIMMIMFLQIKNRKESNIIKKFNHKKLMMMIINKRENNKILKFWKLVKMKSKIKTLKMKNHH